MLNDLMIKLVQDLKNRGIIRSPEVEHVMSIVDRADFCSNNCYEDSPQSIGDNATISAPHMHAFALEAALPFIDQQKSQRVLDVGSGSGYLCVAFAKLLGPKSKVYGIDHMQSLIDSARLNTQKNNSDLLEKFQIYFVCEDGRKGFLPGSPYDIVNVGASSPEVPKALIEQTKTGGNAQMVASMISAVIHGLLDMSRLPIFQLKKDFKSWHPWAFHRMAQKSNPSEEPVYTVFDDQEIPFTTLNSALTRLSAVLDKPLKGKETFPVAKLQKEHVDFLMRETCLNKIEVECLLTRAGGDLKKAVELYLESPLGKSFKF